MGSLRVNVDGDQVWSKEGNQGDLWRTASIDLSKYTGTNPTILIAGLCGSDSHSDIAIDEVQFITPIPPKSCTFDENMCFWKNDEEDQMDWISWTGSTPSGGTGPSAAAGGDRYLYIETSSPRREKDMAILSSPPLQLSQEMTLTFK